MPLQTSRTSPKKTAAPKATAKGQEALLAAAVPLFAERGLKGASARLLAQQAGVNIAAISYHFGGKEGLYHAVIANITEEIAHCMAPMCQQAEAALAQCPKTPEGQAQALAALRCLIMGFATLVLEETQVKNWGRIVLREQIDPSPAFSIIYDGHMQRVQSLLAGLIARCTGASAVDEMVRIRGHLLLGQVLGILSGREALLRSLGIATLAGRHKALVYNMLWVHTQAALAVTATLQPVPGAPCTQGKSI